MDEILGRLRDLFDARLVQERPRIVVKARDAQDVLRLIRFAAEHSLHVMVLGTGSSCPEQLPIPKNVIALIMSDYTEPMELDLENLTLTAGAGVRVAALSQQLQSGGWEYRFLPDTHRATLGGAVAGFGTHASSPPYQSLRDFLLGLKAAYSEGYLLQWGGKMVKDVAGLNMSSLLLGSRGALGVILEVTLRLVPYPSPIYDSDRFDPASLPENSPAASPSDAYRREIQQALDPHGIFYQLQYNQTFPDGAQTDAVRRK